MKSIGNGIRDITNFIQLQLCRISERLSVHRTEIFCVLVWTITWPPKNDRGTNQYGKTDELEYK